MGADELDTAKAARVKNTTKKDPKNVKKDGLHKTVSINASALLNDNRSVIGQQDGSQVTLGFGITADFLYLKKAHEVQFGGLLAENFTRTVELERFVKTNDQLQLKTAYLFHVSTLWGPFARASLETSLLPGYVSTSADATYLKNEQYAVPKTTDDMKITESFSPLTLKQSMGAFITPLDKKVAKATFSLGFGAIEVFAANAFKVDDDAATAGVIELVELEDYQQGGASFLAELSGVFKLNTDISYKLTLDILMPFLYDDAQDRDPLELTNIDASGTLSAKLTSWLAINYQFKFLNQPQLLDEWQIQNNVSITANFNLFQ